MDVQEFREFGRAAIDFVADYLENIRDRFVVFENIRIDDYNGFNFFLEMFYHPLNQDIF